MKINKKVNYSRIAASYLFLGTLVTFISLGARTCLASAVDVNNFSDLEKAVGDNNTSAINIKADSITLDQKLPAISRNLTTSGETGGKSILDGNKTQTILEFNPVNNIAINNIHFQNSYNEDPFDNGDSFDNGGGAVHIGKRKILFSGTNFSNSTATPRGGAILDLGGRGDRANILRFNGKATFSSNESTSGDGGAVLDLTSGK